jgi:hypothetical protein
MYVVDLDNIRAFYYSGKQRYLIDKKGVLYLTNMTLQEVLTTRGKVHKRIIKEVRFPSVCPKCWGSGTTDWISNIVGNKMPKDIEAFKRNPKSPVHEFLLNEAKIYSFESIVEEGKIICKTCYGCGLHYTVISKYLGEFANLI